MASPLLATRAGLDENEDRAVLWWSWWCRQCRTTNQTSRTRGKERTKRNIWVDELLKSTLELGRCNCQRFEPGRKAALVLSSISPGGQRNTGGKIYFDSFLLISVFVQILTAHV